MPVSVYTAHCACYRGRDRVDLTTITARSRAFVEPAVTECVSVCAQEQQTREQYLAFLRTSYRSQRSPWLRILACSRVVIVCTCPPGMRTCRRYVLADVFGKLGASLGGELRQAPHPRLPMRPRHGQ